MIAGSPSPHRSSEKQKTLVFIRSSNTVKDPRNVGRKLSFTAYLDKLMQSFPGLRESRSLEIFPYDRDSDIVMQLHHRISAAYRKAHHELDPVKKKLKKVNVVVVMDGPLSFRPNEREGGFDREIVGLSRELHDWERGIGRAAFLINDSSDSGPLRTIEELRDSVQEEGELKNALVSQVDTADPLQMQRQLRLSLIQLMGILGRADEMSMAFLNQEEASRFSDVTTFPTANLTAGKILRAFAGGQSIGQISQSVNSSVNKVFGIIHAYLIGDKKMMAALAIESPRVDSPPRLPRPVPSVSIAPVVEGRHLRSRPGELVRSTLPIDKNFLNHIIQQMDIGHFDAHYVTVQIGLRLGIEPVAKSELTIPQQDEREKVADIFNGLNDAKSPKRNSSRFLLLYTAISERPTTGLGKLLRELDSAENLTMLQRFFDCIADYGNVNAVMAQPVHRDIYKEKRLAPQVAALKTLISDYVQQMDSGEITPYTAAVEIGRHLGIMPLPSAKLVAINESHGKKIERKLRNILKGQNKTQVSRNSLRLALLYKLLLEPENTHPGKVFRKPEFRSEVKSLII